MICLSGELGKGSCRSYGGFNLFDALTACAPWLEGFGGHALAAGLTIKRENVDGLYVYLLEYYKKAPPPQPAVLACELRVEDPALLTMDCVASLERLEPYGAGNPRPTLCITDALLERVTPIGGGKHLRLRIAKGGAAYDAVMFSCREEELGARAGDRVDAAFFPQVNEYHGVRSVQLLMTALRPADTLPLCREVLGARRAWGPGRAPTSARSGRISCRSGAGWSGAAARRRGTSTMWPTGGPAGCTRRSCCSACA